MLKRLKRWLSDEHPEQVLIDMRPERPRHWHNPADPIQSARIEAAAHERARKAEARETVIFRGWYYNKAHEEGSNLDPYRVASA